MVLKVSFCLAIAGTLFFHSGKEDRNFIRKYVLIHPPAHLEHMTLGYRDLVADALWIRVIQDYDLCEASNTKFVGGVAGQKCSEGWIFRMVDAITQLSPRFRMPYATGGTILTVIVEDYIGAQKIFAKAEKIFPDDFVFPYRAAYNFMFGLNSPLEASAALWRASKLKGAPSWLPLLAARQAKEGGRAELGMRILDELVAEKPEWENNERLAELKRNLAQVYRAEQSGQAKRDQTQDGKRSPTGATMKQNSKTP